MSYLIRKTDTFLRNWKKNPDRYPLIIKGARQVGKTETIRKFAKENYKNLVEINFITEPAYKTIIDEGFSADNILKLISRIDPSKHFDAGETLLFFDEIQDFPEIATSLKFFKKTANMTLYVPAPCLVCNIIELPASASVIKPIIRCILWILKSFYGQKDIRNRLYPICLSTCFPAHHFQHRNKTLFQIFFWNIAFWVACLRLFPITLQKEHSKVPCNYRDSF